MDISQSHKLFSVSCTKQQTTLLAHPTARKGYQQTAHNRSFWYWIRATKSVGISSWQTTCSAHNKHIRLCALWMKPISAVWGSDKSVNAYFRGDLVSLVAGYSSALCFNCNSTQALLFEDQRRGRVEAVPPLLFKKTMLEII